MLEAAESPLCVLTIHAHPDDEASKGAPTLAKYHDLGVRTVLVCCTGGEEGDLKAIKPHFFTCVPRLLEKVYEKILAKGMALKGPKRWIFFRSLELADE
jgi:LmbE family N-acetylglucosaminyl deacetylase